MLWFLTSRIIIDVAADILFTQTIGTEDEEQDEPEPHTQQLTLFCCGDLTNDWLVIIYNTLSSSQDPQYYSTFHKKVSFIMNVEKIFHPETFK